MERSTCRGERNVALAVPSGLGCDPTRLEVVLPVLPVAGDAGDYLARAARAGIGAPSS
jgi:hypothetical protein